MKLLHTALLVLTLALGSGIGHAHAKADSVALYTEAVMTGDIPALESLLAPNYWYINANGHIYDKEHFIRLIKNRELVINHLTITNVRTTMIDNAKLLTGNGQLKGTCTPALPQGLMRYSLVLVNNKGREQVVLVQMTPVSATENCKDGNCEIK